MVMNPPLWVQAPKQSLLRLCVVLAAGMLCQALHAKSDLQLDVGLRVVEASWEDPRAAITGGSPDADDTMYGMCVGLTNYNVWPVGRAGVISVGFMDGGQFSVSEHDATGATFVLGPAFAAEMGRVLTFQAAPAFSLGVLNVEPQPDYSSTSFTVGFALDARVCFMSEARAGPLVGARYEYNKITDLFDLEVDRGAFMFYAGVAMQLSKW